MHINKIRWIGTITTLAILGALLCSGYITESVINSISLNRIQEKRTCVIIDPGHGGIDGGAVSCTGIEESKLNLEISLRLNDLLHLLGIHTKMTRTEDISIYKEGKTIAAKKISDLKERVRFVNQTENAILISIHQNTFHDTRYCGAQVFYNKKSDLANEIQAALIKTLNPTSKRKAKKADGVYLLQNISCPAALVECGFLSNYSEEALLRSAEYQKKLCCVIAASLSCYIHNNYFT